MDVKLIMNFNIITLTYKTIKIYFTLKHLLQNALPKYSYYFPEKLKKECSKRT